MAEIPKLESSNVPASGPAAKAPTIKQTGVLKGHTDSINTIVYHEKNNILVSGSDVRQF
jgi:hypothetical protein